MKKFLEKFASHSVLIFISLLSIFPFIWLISTSLKGAGENIFAYPPTIIPSDFTWENYIGVWKKVDFMAYFWNSMIVAGATGNIIDCVFYGEIFNNPLPPALAQIFPPDGGYAPWFHGKVVDMFYFPLFSFTWPDWMPWVGGEVFEFFKPIFNFADAAISVGILALIFFYHKYIATPEALSQPEPQPSDDAHEE